MKGVYTAKEVAEIVGLQESRVRYWAQTGFVGPSQREAGKALYNFADLIALKAGKELLDRGVTLQRARKNLDALKTQLPSAAQPLVALRVVSDGEQLVCVGEGAPFEPLSGQLVMDFGVGALAGRAAEVLELRPSTPTRATHAYAWFLEGVEIERDDEDRALICYQKAIAAEANFAAPHTNLGALLHRRGDAGEARRHFEEALRLDPAQPEARYNLANLYDEIGERERAVAEWYRVVSECPEFADAHFNLAVALAAAGARDSARAHLEKYLALDDAGEWSNRARAILQDLS